jgi:2-polyprenyl-3-methyl-5-hydroxy-6-metoxy-1,4-benzoquinol methylase
MDKEQQEQDDEYGFPYHYIPEFEDGFQQYVEWTWGKNYVSAIEFLLSQLKADPSAALSMADIGCGDGKITRELARAFVGTKVVGIDYSSKSINLARALNPGLQFINSDIIKQPPGETFDLITLIEVFEHIPTGLCQDFVLALTALLNSGGVIHLTVPHTNKPVSYKHFQHFTSATLKAYFADHFTIEEERFIQRHSKLLRLLDLLMSNSFYLIKSAMLNRLFYTFYKRNFLHTDEAHCTRIYLKLRRK